MYSYSATSFSSRATVSGPFIELLWYLTYWGFLASCFSAMAVIKGSQYKAWQKVAYVSLEVAHALNLLIMPAFWIILAPGIYKMLHQQGLSWSTAEMAFHMFAIHFFPFLSTTVNVITTDIKLLKADWKLQFIVGQLYLIFNFLGTVNMKHSVYPIADWSVPWLTAVMYTILSAFMAGAYYGFCVFMDKYLPTRAEKKK